MVPIRCVSIVLALILTGCAVGAPACIPATYTMSPASVTLDHAAAAPANQQQFSESYQGGTCPRPALVALGPVVSSDPVNAPSNPTGLITCLNAAASPITLTSGTASATLTCK